VLSRFRVSWFLAVAIGSVLLLLLFIAWVLFFDRTHFEGGRGEGLRNYEIPREISVLQREAARVREEMEELPAIRDTLQHEGYGYHGGYLPALESLPDQPRWTVDVHYSRSSIQMKQLIVVPAMNRASSQELSYGFPLRFRILKLFKDGQTEVLQEWMDEDYPDPGRVPLVFELDSNYPSGFRLEVFKGAVEGNNEFLALDEIYGATNLGEINTASSVRVSSSFVSLPFWHEDFLIDQKTSLGLPLDVAGETGESAQTTDLFAEFFPASVEKLRVEIDLGENRALGWLSFFPSSSLASSRIPGFGFPRRIEVFPYHKNKEGSRVTHITKRDHRRSYRLEEIRPDHNLVRLQLHGQSARWLRVEFSDFPISGNKAYFALGEIAFSYRGESFEAKSIRQLKSASLAQSPEVLIDGKADGREVMDRSIWIRKVEERQDLKTALGRLEVREKMLRDYQLAFSKKAWFWVIVFTVLFLAGLFFYLLSSRKKSARQLREQIASDLHDDIGSSLSAISLGIGRLRRHSESADLSSGCERVESIIRRTQNSFQDILWFTNSREDSLKNLIQKLVRTARQRIPSEKLEIECPEFDEHAERRLKALSKRDVFLIYSEVLNNALRHSNASEIRITFTWTRRRFSISLFDNGSGFNMDSLSGHKEGRPQLGLQSLRRRARRLGAELELRSRLGEGTHVGVNVRM